ncbi:type II secretion system F family protein [uncultured Vagococcus sp.]|uniref:type II secretion system F family protein n=1 Tax=uncultured Vagococcus sp. TaxID=189676 RepID=UPI0028D32CA4|nr:type II secretion system F family protein [uncultured Vagococcus sp.]
MAQYSYQARDINGHVRKGRMSADSRSTVRDKLKSKRLKPIEVFEMPETLATKEITFLEPKVKLKDLVFYLTQFSTLISAGITVIRANEMLVQQTSSKVLKNALESVVDDLKAGQTLSSAYEKFPKVFPPMLTNVIKAAEASGTLEATLLRMAIFFDKQNRSKNKLISSMIYPIILMVMAVCVSIFLMVYVVPMFVDVFDQMGGELPGITVVTRDVSIFLKTKGWLIVVFLIIAFVIFRLLLRSPEFRLKIDIFKLRLPGFGELIQKSNISIIMSTLASLLSSSVSVVTALEMAQGTVDNLYMKNIMLKCRNEVEKGSSMSIVLHQSWAFPALVTQMVEVGESTGALESMLTKLADIYEEEVAVASERFKSIMEPLIIIFIAVVVGFIIAAIMTPMFSLYQQMQG